MRDKNLNYISINQAHLLENIDIIKKNIGSKPIYFVCKSNCYGIGLKEMYKIKEAMSRFDGFCVAEINEGILLRKWGEVRPIIVLNPIRFTDHKLLAKYNLEYVISGLEDLQLLSKKQIENGHLAIDCGLGRIGLRNTEIETAKLYMDACGTAPKGIYTHFSTDNKVIKQKEIDKFDQAIRQLKRPNMLVHSEASNYFVNELKSESDFFRFGAVAIGMNSKVSNLLCLKNIVELISHVVFKKYIAKGERIGYNGEYISEKCGWLVNIPLGYGMGLSSKSIGHQVAIGNKFGRIVSICMNQSMIFTDFEIEVGEKIVIIGGGEVCSNKIINLTNRLHIHEDELFCRFDSTMKRIIKG